MPDNQNMNENPNAYDYNPNRPQTGSSPKNEVQNEHADTQKVVDTAAKAASEYFAPGVGGMAYDAAKKVPVVGDAIDKTTGAVAEVADQVPGVKKVTKGLNDSGITDAARTATDLIGSKGASAAKGAGNAAKGMDVASKGTTAAGDVATPVMPTRKNNDFNSRMRNGENVDLPSSTGDSGEMLPQDSADSLSSSELPSDDIESGNNEGTGNGTPAQDNLNPLKGNDSNNNDNDAEAKGDVSGQLFKKIWDRYKIPIILGGGGIALFFLLLLVIFGGGAGDAQTMGYVDTACNFNETKVTVTNCYQSSSERNSLATYNLDDLVVRLAYAYTNSGSYSDDAIKALMVALKTNILSYGNYNSSDKEVDVRICDVFSGYEEIPEDSNDELWMLDVSEDDLSSLESLYDEISNYLYISSSYRSTISNLSSQNILNFNNNTLNEFESLASEGNTYSQILNHFYNASSDDNDAEDNVYRETLFLGDSRTRGMQNAGVINSGNTIYGVGYGYNWLVGNGDFSSSNTNATNGGIDGINDLMRDNASYNIVIWLGVNDLGNVNLYYEEYEALATGDWRNHNIYIVSVGPIVTGASTSATNEAIESFNSTMSSLISSSGLNNLFYIDLGITEDDIQSSDGIHYSSDDYVDIYNNVMSYLDTALNTDYQLYNLTSYCTYYTLTENDAYWWPIGSSEATQGNIYGGDPVSTTITSTFGGRYHPTTGEWQDAHGAIDIGGVGVGTPVIATKSGEVTYTNTGCSEGDHSCGGSYGNHIKIDHGDGIESLYAHLSEVLVSEGESVNQGQIIGYTGNTGRSTGPHLHFEIRLNGTRVDPLEYVDPENPRPVQSYTLGDVDDTGSSAEENKAAICTALLNSGFSENAVAGMMVNIAAEGGFRTNNLENCYEENQCCTVNGKNYGYCVHTEIAGFGSDTLYTNGVDSGAYSRESFVNDHAGYGLIQWTSSGRKAGLYDYAQSQNKSIASLSVQLGYLLQELQYDSYALTYKYITGNYSAYDVANTFCQNFESPSNESTVCPARASANVDEYLSYVQNGCSD